MKIDYIPIDKTSREEDLLDLIRSYIDPNENTLISGGHAILTSDGEIDPFGIFAKETGKFAGAVYDTMAGDAELCVQINDQVHLRGISQGHTPPVVRSFWQNPISQITEDDAEMLDWTKNRTVLKSGFDADGNEMELFLSERHLQRQYLQAGLNNRGLTNNTTTQAEIYRRIYSTIPESALQGSTCRNNGCAHEATMLAPFSVARNFQQLIGFWPLACAGPVLYGSTLAQLLIEREFEKRGIKFQGPFTLLNVFLNSYDSPKTPEDLLRNGFIARVEG